ncbi:MAG: hypothetical protein KAG34_02430 [Cocleimonas sp.]|nr:hypothetical protein [Cocleimonas sp.]
MKKLFLILFSSLLLSTAYAEKISSPETKAVESNPAKVDKSDAKKADKPTVIITKAGTSFEDINESVRMAITDGGMIVSGTLHISDMLNRTGKDIGFEKNIFKKSEAVEFCSALISHKMAVVHPANVSMCPFTIAIYELNDEPGVIYLSYRRVELLGDGKKVEDDIITLLQGIVDESVE